MTNFVLLEIMLKHAWELHSQSLQIPLYSHIFNIFSFSLLFKYIDDFIHSLV
jgi:hypothetical protein